MSHHLTDRAIDQYVIGDIDAAERRQVEEHLAACDACRSQLRALESVVARSRSVPAPEVSPALLDRIHRSMAQQEVVVLPIGATRRTRSLVRWAAIAATILVTAASGLVFVHGRPLVAAPVAGTLRFSPTAPAAGAVIEVTYTAPPMLDGEPSVDLRARYRSARTKSNVDRPIQQRVATLKRQSDGTFTGRFTLPDSVVYAAFAVEDTVGRVVDSNLRRLWELVVHAPDGKPMLSALSQRAHQHVEDENSWAEAYETAKQAVVLYPDSIGAWSALRFYQSVMVPQAQTDSARADQRALFVRFDARLSGTPRLSATDMGTMEGYASVIRDWARARYWMDRLIREAPTSREAVMDLVLLANPVGLSPTRQVARFDSLWERFGTLRDRNLILHANEAAERSEDPAAIRRWKDRELLLPEVTPERVAHDLTAYPALRAEGLSRLRSALGQTEHVDQAHRLLSTSVDDQRREDADRRRTIYGYLGEALIAAGQMRAGLDTIALAAADGWDPALFERIGRAKLSLGDTAGALVMLARVAADPRASAGYADSVRHTIGAAVSESQWMTLLADGRNMMHDRLLAQSVTRAVRPNIHLQDAAGRQTSLGAVFHGSVTTVVFWSRFCPPAIEALPEIEQVANDIHRRGGQLVMIVDEPISAEVRAYAASHGMTMPLFYDVRHEAEMAFQSWGTPMYHVIDGNGVWRYPFASLDGLVARTVTLLPNDVSAVRAR